jgi:hypothetical protein
VKLAKEQHAMIAAMERWRLPTARVTTYAERDVESMRRFDAHQRAAQRQRLAHQWAIALGWYWS